MSQQHFHELTLYTLAHPNQVYFIHQHAVDASAARTADENTKPIKLTFGLIGLYLFLKKGYTGKQVQNAHVKLSQNKKVWPSLGLPKHLEVWNGCFVVLPVSMLNLLQEWMSAASTSILSCTYPHQILTKSPYPFLLSMVV
jgi:hypothetical protein